MTERGSGRERISIPDLESQKEHKYPQYDKLFSALLDASRRGRTPVALLGPGISVLTGGWAIDVRVNPSFQDIQGRPTDVIVDGYVNEVHTQQVVAKAKWNGDVPTVVMIDSSTRNEPRVFVSSDSLADIGRYATEHIDNDDVSGIEMDDLDIFDAESLGITPSTDRPRFLN